MSEDIQKNFDHLDEDGIVEDEDLFSTEEPQLYEHYKVVADRGQSLIRVDKFLCDRLMKTSRNRIQLAADAGAIHVNGSPVKSNYRVKPLDVITIELSTPKREFEIIQENIPLNIIYEDQDLLVINKPAGLVVHPGHGNYTGTMLNGLAYYLRNDPHYDPNDPRLGLVHRIDKDTSGLLVVAKNPDAKANLSMQFFNKTTKRLYNALVWGRLKEKNGTVVGNIGRDPKDRMLMTVFPDGEHGKEAVTHYRLLEQFAYVTLVECQLETGRTHQIRVHMKEVGHPLFNDERYGGDRILKGNRTGKYNQFINNCFELCPRQALHARTLGFIHPKTGKEMNFDSEIPEDMALLLEKWRNYTKTIEGN